jgi:putative aldouronate transport system permease protein
VLQNVWKGSGWGTIIFLAALTSIPTELYEAAAIDGASRYQRMRHVTLPGIRPVILIVLIIQMGNVLNIGFEHIFLLLNPVTEPYAQVLDTFVYTRGIVRGDFSFATAVGLVKGVVGMVMVLTANWLARRFGDGGIL